MKINFKPFYISFNIFGKHIFAGWHYDIKTYYNETEMKLQTKKCGYCWFSGITNAEIKIINYNLFLNKLNRGC